MILSSPPLPILCQREGGKVSYEASLLALVTFYKVSGEIDADRGFQADWDQRTLYKETNLVPRVHT